MSRIKGGYKYDIDWSLNDYIVALVIMLFNGKIDYKTDNIGDSYLVSYTAKWRMWSPFVWLLVIVVFFHGLFYEGLKETIKAFPDSIKELYQERREVQFWVEGDNLTNKSDKFTLWMISTIHHSTPS